MTVARCESPSASSCARPSATRLRPPAASPCMASNTPCSIEAMTRTLSDAPARAAIASQRSSPAATGVGPNMPAIRSQTSDSDSSRLSPASSACATARFQSSSAAAAWPSQNVILARKPSAVAWPALSPLRSLSASHACDVARQSSPDVGRNRSATAGRRATHGRRAGAGSPMRARGSRRCGRRRRRSGRSRRAGGSPPAGSRAARRTGGKRVACAVEEIGGRGEVAGGDARGVPPTRGAPRHAAPTRSASPPWPSSRLYDAACSRW